MRVSIWSVDPEPKTQTKTKEQKGKQVMLVITRRPGDEIVIEPSGIRIVFLGPRKDKDGHITQQGRIGIDAPASEKILRGEILRKGGSFDDER